jgi:large subunit ribosomal protein L30e
MDLAHALKVALQTGKVQIGLAETLASAKENQARMVIVARTCPDPLLTKNARIGKAPIYHYDGTAIELGAACGRPFPISALAILDPGASAILTLETGG